MFKTILIITLALAQTLSLKLFQPKISSNEQNNLITQNQKINSIPPSEFNTYYTANSK